MLFVSLLEFLVRVFKFHNFCGQLHVGIIMPVWHILTAWVALCTFLYDGLFWTPILLILTALHGVMGVVCAPMLLA